MTGEALYGRFCKALADEQASWSWMKRPSLPEAPLAWSHLTASERRVWNATARRLRHKPGVR